MWVIRRLDAALERTKQEVLETKKMLDEAKITAQCEELCAAADEAFYDTSKTHSSRRPWPLTNKIEIP